LSKKFEVVSFMNTLSRVSNAKKNLVFGYASKIIDLLLPFIARTIILYVLSEKYLGISSLFTSILNMLNMTELGFSGAVVFSLYKPLADGDVEKVNAYMSFYKKIYRAIGLIILVIGFALLPLLKYLIKGDVPEGVNIHIVYVIYLFNTAVSYLAFAYKSSLLQADQKMSVVSKMNSIISCSKSIVQILILLITKSFYLYISVLVVATLVNNLWINYAVCKRYPQYSGKALLSKEDRVALFTNVKGVAVSKVCGVMRDSLDSITLSAFVGLTTVAIYGNYYYILSAVHGLMVVITQAIRAGVGNSLCTESVEKNTSDLLKINYIYISIAAWFFTCMVCLYQDFMLVWVGETLQASVLTMVLFSTYFFSLCLGDIRNVYIEAKGLWWEYRYRSIIETVLNAIMNVSFVYFWGINGVLIATIITFWTVNLGYGSTIIFKSYFGKSAFKKYIMQNLHCIVACAVTAAITYYLCSLIVVDNLILRLLIKIATCVVLPIFIYLLLNLKNKYMSDALKMMKKIIKKG